MPVKLPEWEQIRPLHEADPGQKFYSLTKYYSPLFRHLFLKRLELASELIEGKKFEAVLDIGFGSGIFFHELALHADHLFGIDMHPNISHVSKFMGLEEGTAQLAHASIYDLPFSSSCFQCVICLSTFEFIEDVDKALLEVKRVLKKGGIFIAGVPVLNGITSFFYQAVGLKNHREIHKSDHRKVRQEIEKIFSIESTMKLPFFLPTDQSLFVLWRGRNNNG